MGPKLAARAAPRALARNRTSTRLLPAVGCGFDQNGRALVLTITVEMAVGVGQGAFAKPLFLLPNNAAGLELLADPPCAIRVAVEIFIHPDHSAVVIHHVLVRVNLLAPEGPVGIGGDLQECAPGSVA